MSEVLSPERLKYLKLLGESFPATEALCTEITKLSAKLSLPKGTEHFMSDIHGEYEAFCHIMNNCSGVIREKVGLWLGDQLSGPEIDELCTLIYYPVAVLRQRQQRGGDTPDWYRANGNALRSLIGKTLTPFPTDLTGKEKRLIQAIITGDSAKLINMTQKENGILRNWSPELLIMLPELSKPAAVALLSDGFADHVKTRVFQFLIEEVGTPDVLDSFSYRERLMYANLMIHIMQGEAIYPDEDWYPMGNALANGSDRSVYCHAYGYYYDPSHRFEPRFADGEYTESVQELHDHSDHRRRR